MLSWWMLRRGKDGIIKGQVVSKVEGLVFWVFFKKIPYEFEQIWSFEDSMHFYLGVHKSSNDFSILPLHTRIGI
jgi:hypothetical protein